MIRTLRTLFIAAAAFVLAGALPALAQESPTLKKIKAAGEVSIGHREASVPFAYMDQAGKPIGYSVDLCLKVVDEIKKELNIATLKVKFVAINAQTRAGIALRIEIHHQHLALGSRQACC